MNILLIEDSPSDARLAKEAFRASDSPACLHVARDGIEAMEFLLHDNIPRPDLILLDLNLPKIDGRELLSRLKNDDDLKTIPTVVLSSSAAEDDVQYCYRQHATCFIVKPNQWDAFAGVVRFVMDFCRLAVKPQENPVNSIMRNIVADRFYF
jgi:two-component system, chemotaxis family, response regulator Rcp1